MSLLKMIIIKCDENVSTHKRLRGSLENGDVNEADRLLQVLEEQNMINLSDLQYELSNGINIIQMVKQLSDVLNRERVDMETEMEFLKQNQFPRASSPSKNRDRSTSNTRASGADQAVMDLRKDLTNLEIENEKLRATMREMVDDYTRQLDVRDQTIRRLES
tara:strand:- start:232 stop:717 length:486 start_codon:yes stop_codon:yes gene_type:complete